MNINAEEAKTVKDKIIKELFNEILQLFTNQRNFLIENN